MLYDIITVHNDKFDHMDVVMRVLANKNPNWKQDLFSAVKLPSTEALQLLL